MKTQDLMNPETRKQILNEIIYSFENIIRKRRSLGDYEVFNDRAFKYVYEKLVRQLDQKTVDQMPIVSQLNVAKKMVSKRATIYTSEPTRTYNNISKSDESAIRSVYSSGGFNTILGKANKYYALRNQSFLQVLPNSGKLGLRVLQNHNIDVIPSDENPEKAFAYIISSFNKSGLISSDQINQKIADPDDGQKKKNRFQIWTDEIVMTIDGEGKVIELVENQLQMLPFVDISKDKDLQFFVELGQALTDFTVDFNVCWTDLLYTMRLQNFSVGVVSGDPELKPVEMVIGASKWLFMPKNPANPDSKLEFDFKNPTPAIDSSLKAIETLVMTFLSTQGLDTKALQMSANGSSNYSSALERLLAMIDQYLATKDDFSLFEGVEKELHKIVTNYMVMLTGSDLLNPEFYASSAILDSVLDVKFQTPEMVETQSETLANAKTKIEMGLTDKAEQLAKLKGITIEQAVEQLVEIEKRKIDMQKKIQEMRIAAGVEMPNETNENGTGSKDNGKGAQTPPNNDLNGGDNGQDEN